MRKSGIFIVIIIGVAAHGWAGTYFVSQTATGSGNGKTYANRASVDTHNTGSGVFADLDGDTVVLCGDFDDPLVPPDSGKSNGKIIYDGNCSAYQGGASDAHFNGCSDWEDPVEVGQSHIIFRWLEISCGDEAIDIAPGAGHIDIRNSYIHDVKNGVTLRGCPNVTIGGSAGYSNIFENIGEGTASEDIGMQGTSANNTTNVVISYNELRGDGSYTGQDGIMVDNPGQDDVNAITIEHNYIHGHGRENEIDLKGGTNYNIRKNIIVGNDGTGALSDESAIHFQQGSRHIYFYGNVVRQDNETGIASFDNTNEGDAGPAPLRTSRYHFFWSNLIHDNGDSGISLKSNGPSGLEDVYIWNNTIVDNAAEAESRYNTGLQIINNIKGTLLVKNNIFQDNRKSTNSDRTRQLTNNKDSYSEFDYNNYYTHNCTQCDGTGDGIIYHHDADRHFQEWQNHYSMDINGSWGQIEFVAPANNQYKTTSNPTPADNIGEDHHPDGDLGLAPDSNLTPIPCGGTPGGTALCAKGIKLIDRDNYNNGQWGKGAFVFNDSKQIVQIPPVVPNVRIR